jgi:hypothetical protein
MRAHGGGGAVAVAAQDREHDAVVRLGEASEIAELGAYASPERMFPASSWVAAGSLPECRCSQE